MAAQVTAQKATFESGAYSYRASWNGKEYSGGRRFINIVGIDSKREYSIIANAQGEILENAKGFSGAEAAIEALGWSK